MGYKEQSPVHAGSKGEVPRFVFGMVRVRVGDGERVVEDRGRFMKMHAMPRKILDRLPRVPVELQWMLLISFTTTQ